MTNKEVAYYRNHQLLWVAKATCFPQRIVFHNDNIEHIIDYSAKEVIIRCRGEFHSNSVFTIDGTSFQQVFSEFGEVKIPVQCQEITISQQGIYVRYVQDIDIIELQFVIREEK